MHVLAWMVGALLQRTFLSTNLRFSAIFDWIVSGKTWRVGLVIEAIWPVNRGPLSASSFPFSFIFTNFWHWGS